MTWARLISTTIDRHGRIYSGHPNLSCKSFLQVFLASLSLGSLDERCFKTYMAGINPAMSIVNTISFGEVTADCYFFGAIILLSAGFAASALVSAAASGLSMRSILAVSRSLAT